MGKHPVAELFGRLVKGKSPPEWELPPAALAVEEEAPEGWIAVEEEAAEGKPQTFFSSTKPPTPEQAAGLACQMPDLAGQPLEPPRFHKMNWRVGQRLYTDRDDPDRAREQWEHPAFIERKNPVQQRSQTTVEELQVPRAAPGRRFARVVRNTLSQQDCASLLSQVNTKGFTPVLLNVGRDVQQLVPDVRDGHRVIVDSPELAEWLLEVIRPYLPEELEDGSRLAGLNERCRILCYTPGQYFEPHHDGCYTRPHGHPKAGERSRITVQFYLHDVPDAYGGATTFFPGEQYSVKHQPEAGSVLLFTQDLLHEGSLVKRGLKYTLRTEVMYTPARREDPGRRSNRKK